MSSIVESQLKLPKIIEKGVEAGASDIHISPNKPIMFCINGKFCKVQPDSLVKPAETENLVKDLLQGKGKATFEERHSYDTSIAFNHDDEKLRTRARIHFFTSSDGVCLTCRLVPFIPKTLNELGVPKIIKSWVRPGGIILVSGTPGTGKTTTLAALIAHLNDSSEETIIVLEDPIEYFHKDNKSIIIAREVGTHVPDYTDGLKDVHRENTTTVVVGEVRDQNAMDAVFGLAENGLKVFASIHGKSAIHTIEKIKSLYNASEHESVYKRLGWTLSGIINNWLVPKRDGGGRVLACDIISVGESVDDKVKNLLKDGKILQIQDAQKTSREDDMVTRQRSLELLEQRRVI